ncbi:peptidogalycan biosysnthesis protein [Halobacteriovorax sp. JY17]|uniref:peptidogalycan biosysnthesis protein n=1 Tax=Halobacteriovorax sp. JY17 TaxID=2014617 RepID=UPI0025C4E40C|nr:peptidogalycan biosysnthesis protein [Halobacteriovorax sp. JY17]
MQVEIFSSIDHIKESDWNQLIHPDDIFNNYHFHRALEAANCIGEERGQIPFYITISEHQELKSACVIYLKSHSYGEYIFDWSWANLYERYGYNYYPKLIAQNPFTPATNRTLLYSDKKHIPYLFEEICKISNLHNCTSKHLLFLEEDELELIPNDYKKRTSFQYHWKNYNYKNFEEFLFKLKSKKAKQIRRERLTDLEIREIKPELLKEYATIFYKLYASTIVKKQSYAYLNLDFFIYIFTNMSDSTRLIGAFDQENLVAASLFFIGRDKLYGRYWGAVEEYKNLHFELCYYQGIELCIRNNIAVFEAGAQGEHKIARGFEPTKTHSAHQIHDHNFQDPIYNFIDEEDKQIKDLFPELKRKLPFKKI